MKISLAQMQVNQGNIEENFNNALAMIDEARLNNSNIILFPELFLTGFDYQNIDNLSKIMPSYIDKLLEKSVSLAICGTYLENINNKIFNTFYCLYEKKVVFKYSKIKLFEVTNEHKFFYPGSIGQENTFDLFGIKFGVAICFELRFPEFFRKAALKGADILLLSAIWPKERIFAWQALSVARAIENQVFFVGCNAIGQSGQWMCGGYSSVFDPLGNKLECAYEDIALKTVEIEPSYAKKVQSEFPSLIKSYDLYGG